MITKRISIIVLVIFTAIGLWVIFTSPLVLGQEKKDSPQEIYKKATEHFDQQNWKEALILFQRLLDQYGKDSLVKSKLKEIEDKISQCEKNLGIIKDITKIFQGKPKLEKRSNGDKVLKLFYDFSNEDEINDFANVSADEKKIVNQTLELMGSGGYFFCNLKDTIFMNELAVEFTVKIIPPTDQEVVVGVFYDFEKTTGYVFGLNYREGLDPTDPKVNCIKLQVGGDELKTRILCLSPKPKIEPGKPYNVKISAKGGQLTFQVGNEFNKTITEKTYNQGLLRFGGYSSRVQYDNIKIEGVVNPAWLDKAFSKATTEALAERERQPAIPAIDPDKVEMNLSAEADEVLANIAKESITTYKKGKAEMSTIPTSFKNVRDLLKPTKTAQKLFDEALKYYPTFAAAYYQRAKCYERLGETQNALLDFTRAIEKFPDFYEAYCERAEIYLDFSKYQEALADYEKCVSIKSDYSPGYSGRGYLRFILGERDKAMADLDKALELDSTNSEARQYKETLQHVIKGPLWPISYQKETEHFLVTTDMSQTKCDAYAEYLETMYKYYAEMFDLKETWQRKRRVLLFNTEEGYQTYAELSTEDRAEHTLGYYHPHYQELLVFEEVGKEARVFQVLYHEGFHMFIDHFIPNIPIWANEGFAEYFYGTEITRQANKLVITKKGLPIPRLETIQEATKGGAAISFEQIMNESQSEFYENASVRYAQGWSMVHFFLYYQQGTYKKLLMDYMKLLKDGKSVQQAFEETFKKKDLVKMQKEWVTYVQGLKPPK